jgi:hypothetical protein
MIRRCHAKRINKLALIHHWIAMNEVFESYERWYCEASASLTRKCVTAPSLQGGNPLPSNLFILGINPG